MCMYIYNMHVLYMILMYKPVSVYIYIYILLDATCCYLEPSSTQAARVAAKRQCWDALQSATASAPETPEFE